MFKGTKRAASVFALIAAFAALVLSGCVPTGTGAATGADGSAASGGGLTAFLPLIVIIAVFYFILIRPQNKKNKQVNEMRNSLKRGDTVTTIGGFRGRVVRVNDDVVTIEMGSDKTKLEIMRWGISKIEQAAPESKSSSKASKAEELEEEKEAAPKRKPRKLEPVAKKEPVKEEAPEDEELPEFEDEELPEDEDIEDEK